MKAASISASESTMERPAADATPSIGVGGTAFLEYPKRTKTAGQSVNRAGVLRSVHYRTHRLPIRGVFTVCLPTPNPIWIIFVSYEIWRIVNITFEKSQRVAKVLIVSTHFGTRLYKDRGSYNTTQSTRLRKGETR